MAKFKIEIEETLQRVVEVNANNLSDAIQKVEEKYKNEEYVLNENDFKGVEFNEYKDDILKTKTRRKLDSR